MNIKGFNPDKMVVLTMVIEGSKIEVTAIEKRIHEIASRYGGMSAGEESGEKGY